MENVLMVMLAVVGTTTAIPPLLDLSHTYNLDPPASHTVKVIEKSMNRIYIGVELNQICSSELTGTHLEAPTTLNNYSSFSVDAIPIERLWRVPGVVIKIRHFVRRNYEITAEILEQGLNRDQLSIPDGGILLIYTGFESNWELSEDDDGTETPSPKPRLSVDAGLWLANYGLKHGHKTDIIGVGIDLNSLDEKDTNMSTSARAQLYKKDIYALHNLKNLYLLPSSGFLVTVMPMKIFEADGAPVRVLAERDDTRSKASPDYSDRSSEEGYGDWDSERDHIYVYPRWGSDSEAATASAVMSSSNPLLMGLTILMVLIRGG